MEEERLRGEIVEGNRPAVDIESLVAGKLAGPASPDRPSVPVWEYESYLEAHPEVSMESLSQVRFPITYSSGGDTVTSIAELIAPGPIKATYKVTPRDIIRLYELMHEAGAMRWNSETRTHEEVKPLASYQASVYGRWREELEAKRASTDL